MKNHQNKFFIEGGLSFANFTLLNGAFLIGFAIWLGANDLEIGIMSALPLFTNLIQVFSAFLIDIVGTRKWTAITSLLISRSLWVVMILMAFGIITKNILLVMVVLFISCLANSIGGLAQLSWIKTAVQSNELANFLGKRNISATATGIIVYLAGSFLLDKYTSVKIYGYVFGVAVLLGLLGVLFLTPIPEEKKAINKINKKKLIKRLTMPLKDKNFRPFFYYGAAWGFALNLASPFFTVFMIKELKLNFFLIAIFLGIDALGKLYGYNTWKKFANKYGSRPILIICTTVSSFLPLSMMFITKSNYYLIPVFFFIFSFSFAGIDVGIGQATFRSAPRKYDAYYIASFQSVNGLMSALGPIVGGVIAMVVPSTGFFVPLKVVFLISFLFRISTIPLAARLHEPSAKEVDDCLDNMKTLRVASFFVNIYSVASYASKIVLLPQKQLFILQRRAARKLKNNIRSTVDNMEKIIKTLEEVKRENYYYYKSKLRHMIANLKGDVDKLSYFQGTSFQLMPKLALNRTQKLVDDAEKSKNIDTEIEDTKNAIRHYEDQLEKEYMNETTSQAKKKKKSNGTIIMDEY